MKFYPITSIFYSIIGEGHYTGTPAIFLRMAGCSVGKGVCTFCDTDFRQRETLNKRDIVRRIKALWPGDQPRVLITGGEPLDTFDNELGQHLTDNGCIMHLETSGAKKITQDFNYISVSPKVNDKALVRNLPKFGVQELRYPIRNGDPLPETNVYASLHFLSPIFNGNESVQENIDWAVKLVKENPHWLLSLQMHKYGGFD